MAADSGGGTPSGAFGSRFNGLGDMEYEWRTQKNRKLQKRTAGRNSKNEFEFTKQLRMDTQNAENSAGRYLIVTRTDAGKTMDDLDPFFIKKAINAITSNIKIERYKMGTLLLKTVNKLQADKMLKQTKLNSNIGIKVEDHPTMNICKGTIYCPDLKKMTDERILEEMKQFDVVEVKRMQRKNKDGKLFDTGVFILSFNLASLPNSIEAGFHNCKVRHFIPNPIRCMNCLKYGHKKDKCKGNQICAQCAGSFHDNRPCKTGLTCVNCRGKHTALSRECPIYLDEFEIQRIRVEERLTLREAKEKRRSRVPDPRLTLPSLLDYAAALKRNLNRAGQNNRGNPIIQIQTEDRPDVHHEIQPEVQTGVQPEVQPEATTSQQQHKEPRQREQRENPRGAPAINADQRKQGENGKEQLLASRSEERPAQERNQFFNPYLSTYLNQLRQHQASPSWADMMEEQDDTINQTTPSMISITENDDEFLPFANDLSCSDLLSQAVKASMFSESDFNM